MTGPIAFDGWANWNGTSFATPHVVAAIARILADASPTGLYGRLSCTTSPRRPSPWGPSGGLCLDPNYPTIPTGRRRQVIAGTPKVAQPVAEEGRVNV